MGSKKKIGVRIDEDLWEDFKSYVENKHGRTRGVTADEVETALRNHLQADHPTDALARIENDVATIKAQLTEADGGVDVTPDPSTSNADAHTHGTNGTEDEHGKNDHEVVDKPHAKAPKSKKVEWYGSQKVPEMPIVAPPGAFRAWVDDAWDFGERARDDLLRRIFERYHAKAVKRKRDDSWEVVIAHTEAEREERIDAYGEDVGEVFVLEDETGHVEKGDVFDNFFD